MTTETVRRVAILARIAGEAVEKVADGYLGTDMELLLSELESEIKRLRLKFRIERGTNDSTLDPADQDL
jgi:hypothetical protein